MWVIIFMVSIRATSFSSKRVNHLQFFFQTFLIGHNYLHFPPIVKVDLIKILL